MKLFIRALCALTFSIPVYATEWQSPLNQDHPQVGKVYELSSQMEISSTELYDKVHKASIVLVGEKHDNPDHHRIERDILKAFTRLEGNQAVIFEMLDDSQQPGIDMANEQPVPDNLKKILHWDDKQWAWDDYGPIIKQALHARAKVQAGNLSRDQIRSIYSGGEEVLTSNDTLTSALGVNNALRKSMLEEIYTEHCEMLPRDKLAPMVNIQLARDARMAAAVDQSNAKSTLLIAGGYHVRKDSAVPLHLRLRDNKEHPLVIMLREVDPTLQNYTDILKGMASQADYVWFTPRFTDRDYCSDLKTSQK